MKALFAMALVLFVTPGALATRVGLQTFAGCRDRLRRESLFWQMKVGAQVPTPRSFSQGFRIAARNKNLSVDEANMLEIMATNGPNLVQWEAQTRTQDPALRAALRFLRNPGFYWDTSSAYLQNQSFVKDRISTWLKAFLNADIEPSFRDWMANLRLRHKDALGTDRGTTYEVRNGNYNTADFNAGIFRFELPNVAADCSESDVAWNEAHEWLRRNGYTAPNRERAFWIEVAGIADALREAKQSNLILSSYDPATPSSAYYAYPTDQKIYLAAAWSKLLSFRKDYLRYQKLSPSHEKNILFDRLLNHLSDYFQVSTVGMWFPRVNNSILMNEINLELEAMGLLPVQHGDIDHIALRMDFVPFRSYFKDFLQLYFVSP